MGLIYRAYNKITGKSYVGQTINSFTTRKNRHYNDARKGGGYHFHKALRKYNIDDWEWSILKEVEDSALSEWEMYYIGLYNTYKAGYNSTLGGESTSMSSKVIILYHKDYGWVEDTIYNFINKYKLKRQKVLRLSRGVVEESEGWRKSKPKQLNKKIIKRKVHVLYYNNTVIKGTTKELTETYNIGKDKLSKIKCNAGYPCYKYITSITQEYIIH